MARYGPYVTNALTIDQEGNYFDLVGASNGLAVGDSPSRAETLADRGGT